MAKDHQDMRQGVIDRTILAPLALILVAALLTLPIAVLLAGRDVEHMSDERLSGMVGEMFSGHLDDVADNLARELLARNADDLAKANDVLVLDEQGSPVGGRLKASADSVARATAMTRDLAQASSIDAYRSQLQWRQGQPFVAVAVREPDNGHVLVGLAPLDAAHLRGDFADRLQLTDFHLDRRSVTTRGRTRAPVVWQDQADGSSISWKREDVGGMLVRRLLPLVVVLMAVIAGAGLLMLRRARELGKGVLAAQAQAEYLALHDGLTGLANRALFMQNLELALARHQRGLAAVGVYMVDLDRFKQVNDTLGHQAGDDLIVETARRLQATCRAGDTVARFGGDEFAIVATAPSEGGLEAMAERLVEALQGDVAVRGGSAVLSASVGMAIMGEMALDGVELLRRADLALYNAKHGGRARHSYFEPALEVHG
jgi:diguanylate cyclase (GGDEF)-like protein